MNIIFKNIKAILPLFVIGISLFSCNNDSVDFQEFYEEGKPSSGISLKIDAPQPESGVPGTEVLFKAAGLLGKKGQFDFLINNEKAEVLTVTDSTVTIKVPALVSSGLSSIIYKGQVFFGPRFKVEGNISIDDNFGLNIGTNGPIYDYIEVDGGYVLVGGFTNIQNKAEWWNLYNGIASISESGNVFNNDQTAKGGASGSVFSISKLSDNKLIVSGSINVFDNKVNIDGITRLNQDTSLDIENVEIVNLTPDVPANGMMDVPVFNGGTPDQIIVKSFVNQNDEIIAIGNLRTYAQADYSQSTIRTTKFDYQNIKTIIRLDKDGNLDNSYHSTGQGVDGTIYDGFIQEDDKVVMVGSFSQYDGEEANNIVRVDANGNYDASFITGTGANGSINSVQYNANTGKIMLTGVFTEFNGEPCNGVVMLNSNGSLDENFVLKEVTGGRVTFAKSLNTGKVLVSGNFITYDGVTRRGFLILNNDGTVTQNFNIAGSFDGQIYQVIETTSSRGFPALILIGFINKFDDVNVGNIVKVEIKNN